MAVDRQAREDVMALMKRVVALETIVNDHTKRLNNQAARLKRLEDALAAGQADMVARVGGRVVYDGAAQLTVTKDTVIGLVE